MIYYTNKLTKLIHQCEQYKSKNIQQKQLFSRLSLFYYFYIVVVVRQIKILIKYQFMQFCSKTNFLNQNQRAAQRKNYRKQKQTQTQKKQKKNYEAQYMQQKQNFNIGIKNYFLNKTHVLGFILYNINLINKIRLKNNKDDNQLKLFINNQHFIYFIFIFQIQTSNKPNKNLPSSLKSNLCDIYVKSYFPKLPYFTTIPIITSSKI
eukprot:TRINITY_DN27609_c0_g1_i2.p2 TRINITY_DN27609_c0_g1~~TRINITY_DN27609_c0_g1_i2.p2  ORF type:complete len:206 (+),score=-12.52 TRINITY_DN27609_c0_g1_i2:632-1249(+)